MQTRRVTFDFLVCLSLCNLLLLRVWAQLLPGFMHSANLYYMKQAPHWIHYPVVLLVLFAVSAAGGWLGARARRSGRAGFRAAAAIGLLLLFLLALNAITAQFAPGFAAALEGDGRSGATRLAVATLLAVAGFALWRWPRFAIGGIEACAVFAVPFVGLTVGQALWTWMQHDPARFAGAAFVEAELADWLPRRPGATERVVWIVFDELDQRATFEARPAGLALPAFDRLREESLLAAEARPPASETRRSISSLLLGRPVSWAQPDGANTLPCVVDGGPRADAVRDCWAFRSVFEAVRGSGRNSAIAGWFHPYCRIFFESVSDCAWAGLPYWDTPSIFDSLDQQRHEVVKAVPVARLWLRPGTRVRGSHRTAFEVIFSAALRQVGDARVDFAFVHLPVPHHPDIFDPDTGELSIDDGRSYFDNLLLADRSLAALRERMETAGLWDETSVIVTSDHWWRAIHRGDWGLTDREWAVFGDGPDRRVPVLIKLAGRTGGGTYAEPFNTLLLHDLVLALLAGDLGSPEQLTDWLDRERLRVPLPESGGEPATRRFSPR